MQNVSRNGTMLLNLTQHGRGDLDPQVIQIGKDIGAWLKVNGEAIYASRPFEVFRGKYDLCYTRNNGNVYATLLDWTRRPGHSQGPARRRSDPWAKCPKSNCSAPTSR